MGTFCGAIQLCLRHATRAEHNGSGECRGTSGNVGGLRQSRCHVDSWNSDVRPGREVAGASDETALQPCEDKPGRT